MRAEKILEHVSELEIFNKYISQDFVLGKPFLSELRNEKHPSANVFYAGRARRWLYHDFAHRTLDCFGYVMMTYGVSFKAALDIIAEDFYLETRKNLAPRPERKMISLPRPSYFKRNQFIYKTTAFNDDHIRFIQTYGICLKTLQIYNVKAVEYFYSKGKKDKIIYAGEGKPIFMFIEKHGVKFYAPNHPKWQKFRTNLKKNEFFGYSLLSEYEEHIGITGGQKDVLTIFEHMGIKSIALNSESATLPEWLFLDLKKRTPNLFILYDNDKTGIVHAREIADQYNIRNISLSDYLGYCCLKGSQGIDDISKYVKQNLNPNPIENEIKTVKDKELQAN